MTASSETTDTHVIVHLSESCVSRYYDYCVITGLKTNHLLVIQRPSHNPVNLYGKLCMCYTFYQTAKA